MYTEERKVVHNLLRKFNVTSKYRGYFHVIEATMMYVENHDRYLMITKEVYPTVAKKLDDTPYCVEHNIRCVIARCWKNNKELLQSIANYPLPERPSNSEFLDILAYYVSSQVNHE